MSKPDEDLYIGAIWRDVIISSVSMVALSVMLILFCVHKISLLSFIAGALGTLFLIRVIYFLSFLIKNSYIIFLRKNELYGVSSLLGKRMLINLSDIKSVSFHKKTKMKKSQIMIDTNTNSFIISTQFISEECLFKIYLRLKSIDCTLSMLEKE